MIRHLVFYLLVVTLGGCASSPQPTEHRAVVGGGSWGRNHAQPVAGVSSSWNSGVESTVVWTPSIYTDGSLKDEWGSFAVEFEIPIWSRSEK